MRGQTSERCSSARRARRRRFGGSSRSGSIDWTFGAEYPPAGRPGGPRQFAGPFHEHAAALFRSQSGQHRPRARRRTGRSTCDVRSSSTRLTRDVDVAAAQYATAEDDAADGGDRHAHAGARRAARSPTTPTGAAKPRSSSFSTRSAPSTRRCRPGTRRGPSTRGASFWSGRPSERTQSMNWSTLAAWRSCPSASARAAVRARHTDRRRSRRCTAVPVRSGNIVRFDAASPQLERIHVAPVAAAMLPVDEFEAPGKVEPLPTRLAKVALPLSGRVRQVMVTLGDHVRSGQTLMTVETPESSTLQSALRQAQADVEAPPGRRGEGGSRCQPRPRSARQSRDCAKGCRGRRSRARRGDRRPGAGASDRGRCDPAIAGCSESTSQTPEGLVTVALPMNGEVVDITVAPGEYRSDTAAPVMTVADLSRVWVVASVPESRSGAGANRSTRRRSCCRRIPGRHSRGASRAWRARSIPTRARRRSSPSWAIRAGCSSRRCSRASATPGRRGRS